MLKLSHRTLKLVSKLSLTFPSSKSFSLFHYRIHYQSQDDLHACFNWDICRNIEDVCYFFGKNYLKQTNTNNELSVLDLSANTFSFQDIFLQEDHLRLLEKISKVISTFQPEQDAHNALLLFLLKSLNKDLQFILYNHRVVYQPKLLYEEVLKNIMNITRGIVAQMAQAKQGNKDTELYKEVKNLLLNHNLITKVSEFEGLFLNYMQLTVSLDLFKDQEFRKEFATILNLWELEKVLKVRDRISKMKLPQETSGELANIFNEFILDNIEIIENYKVYGQALKIIQSREVSNFNKKACSKAYQQFKIIIEKDHSENPLSNCHDVHRVIRTLNADPNCLWFKIFEDFRLYSKKCLLLKNLESAKSGDINEYLKLLRTVYQRLPFTANEQKVYLLKTIQTILYLLKKAERTELFFLVRIISLVRTLKGGNEQLIQEIYDDIYNVLKSEAFHKNLTEIRETDMMKYVDDILDNKLEEIYSEDKWCQIKIDDLPFTNQVIAASYLYPLVEFPSDFYSLSKEKEKILQNDIFYYVKLKKFMEKLDKDFQDFFKDIRIHKSIEKYGLEYQLSFIKELLLLTNENDIPPKNYINIAKNIARKGIDNLYEQEPIVNVENLFFVIHKAGLFKDEAIFNKAETYVKENYHLLNNTYLAQIFFFFAESGTLRENLSVLLQQHFMKRLKDLGPFQFFLITLAVKGLQLKPYFHQELFEILKIRSSSPEYAGLVCEFLYYEVKTKNRKTVFLDRILPRLKIALEKDSGGVSFYELDRLLPYVTKFKDVDWLFNVYRKKLDEFLVKPNFRYLAQVYCNFTQVSGEKHVLEKLEKIIIDNINSFKPIQVTQLLSSLLQRYEHNANNELIDKLLEVTMKEGFFSKQADDVVVYKDFIKTIDVGILSIIFFQHCMFLKDKSMDFIQKRLFPLIQRIINERTHGTESQIFNEPKHDIKHNFISLHVNQILQGLLALKYVRKMETDKKLIDELIAKLNNVYFFFENYKDFGNKSYFQGEVWVFLKDKLFSFSEVQKEHKIPPFNLDFCIEDSKLAIECQGRQHYLYDGKTLKFVEKRRNEILKELGYHVVMIPIQEWKSVNFVDREEYLRKKIESVGVTLKK